MATEEQISELYNRIVEQEKRRDQCCRDIIIWEAHTQIVRLNTLNISNESLIGGGSVISTFDDNVATGIMRRGLAYTVTFPIKWDNSLYVPRNIASYSYANCSYTTSGYKTIVNYRIVEENSIEVSNCSATNNNYARFWHSVGANLQSQLNNNVTGHLINPNNNWGQFVHDIKDDGTVTITDHRRNTNFNIIRFYTQWILRRTADNQMIPDPTFE